MELKKNPKADLEKSKSIFFLIGLAVALGAILYAFNASSTQAVVEELERVEEVNFEDEVIQQTRQEKPPEVTPPPPKQEIAELNIVDDEEDIDEEFIPQDAEADEETEVEIVTQVVEQKKEEEEEKIFVVVEKMPQFPGGDLGLRKYIATHVKYPNVARESGIEGKVYLRFCVTSTGAVKKVSVLRSVDPLLDKEAMRVVKSLPKWTPGEQRGKKVNVWYTVPINFQLQ